MELHELNLDIYRRHQTYSSVLTSRVMPKLKNIMPLEPSYEVIAYFIAFSELYC